MGQLPGRLVEFLPVDGDVQWVAAMRLDELLRLDEHAARPARRVVDPLALPGFQDLHEQLHHTFRSEVLAALATLLKCELPEKVFVDLAHDVPCALAPTVLT